MRLQGHLCALCTTIRLTLVASLNDRHNPRMISPARFQLLIGMALLLGPVAWAGPFIPAGDLALRHDIQRLADAGIIKGPTTTWPAHRALRA